MNNNILVTKRDGSKEPLAINKFHKVASFACEGLAGVSASELELKTQIQFYNGITTNEIQETLIKAAADLITEDSPNYQYVAGRLVNYHLRKLVYNDYRPDDLYTHITKIVGKGFYTKELTDKYTKEEIDKLDGCLDHGRDELLTYAAMEQFRGKYLVRNRDTGEIFETPQMAYMLIAMCLFAEYPRKERHRWVKDFYDAVSTFDISLPTPVMAGVRTPDKQFSSCTLIETDDSLDSINATSGAILKYVSNRAGIGIGAGRIRSFDSPIRGGAATHTGVTPFFRLFEASTNSCSQGGVRKGSGTLNAVCWHHEIEDILVLKNNKGTQDNRVRQLDYCIHFNKTMYERLIEGRDITLFSPHECPDLYDAFYGDPDAFKTLYEAYERKTSVRKKTIPAIELFSMFMQERKDTGRIYLMNTDHVNQHGSFTQAAPIRMTNLCVHPDTVVTVMDEVGAIADVKISELIERGATDFKVLSNDLHGTDEFKTIISGSKTKRVYELVKITTPRGNVLKVTPEHLIYTTNRGYVRADELQESDELLEDG